MKLLAHLYLTYPLSPVERAQFIDLLACLITEYEKGEHLHTTQIQFGIPEAGDKGAEPA